LVIVRLFLYEHITGGGFLETDLSEDQLPTSLLTEGRAMITVLASDALRIPDLTVDLLWDSRLPLPPLPSHPLHLVSSPREAESLFTQLAREATATIVIAPESGGILASRAASVLLAGGTLLGPSPELIDLCADKHRTAEHLRAAGVPVPAGSKLSSGEVLPLDVPYPAVLKPLDGCGSEGLQWISSPTDAAGARVFNPLSGSARLESFIEGQAASVAVLCGPKQTLPLPACTQLLSTDGTFAYQGGSFPLSEKLSSRAEHLAQRAVLSLDQPRGYLGFDLILGAAEEGSQDAVIEINPRLTTSYVGLRQATRENLLWAWWRIAQGETVALSFDPQPVQFLANGEVSV